MRIHLPTKKTKPALDFQTFRYLIFGAKKIGKTTLCSHIPDALFLPTESGCRDLSVYQSVDKKDRPILLDTWPLFKGWAEAFIVSKQFKTVVVDTVDQAYNLCYEYVCTKMAMESPSDEAWGKGWRAIYNEFHSVFQPLLETPGKGCILLSHAKSRKIERWDEEEPFEQWQCSLSGMSGEYITGAVDLWGYYGYKGQQRRLYIEGNQLLDVGHRFENHFFTPEGKRLPYIPMGSSPAESYKYLQAAFNNKLSLGKKKKGKKKK